MKGIEMKAWIRDDIGMEIAARHVFGAVTPACSFCEGGDVRFYYHEWEPLPQAPRVRRGAVWVWCATCRHFTSAGNFLLSDDIEYTDALIGIHRDDIGDMETKGTWIAYLNALWDAGRLARSATRKAVTRDLDRSVRQRFVRQR